MGLFKKKEEKTPAEEPKTEEIVIGECFKNVCPDLEGIAPIMRALKACKTVKELDEVYMEGLKGTGIMVGYIAAAIDAQREMIRCYNDIDTMPTNDSTAFFKSTVLITTGVMCGNLEPQRMGAQAYINFFNRDVEPLYEHLRKKLALEEVFERNKIDKRIELQMANNEIERLKEKIAGLEEELAKKDGKETGE